MSDRLAGKDLRITCTDLATGESEVCDQLDALGMSNDLLGAAHEIQSLIHAAMGGGSDAFDPSYAVTDALLANPDVVLRALREANDLPVLMRSLGGITQGGHGEYRLYAFGPKKVKG